MLIDQHGLNINYYCFIYILSILTRQITHLLAIYVQVYLIMYYKNFNFFTRNCIPKSLWKY